MSTIRTASIVVVCTLALAAGCRGSAKPRTFGTPEEAVKALADAVRAENVDALMALFGPDAADLIDRSDVAGARRNRQVFAAAAAEGWHLTEDGPDKRVLVIGNEEWPFPVPIVKRQNGWEFDGAAGREEVIARRIGRNELAAIQACRTYVTAQELYARNPHDGKKPGLYAATFRSDRGRQNGLFWPVTKGGKRSPLGDLIAEAADPERLRLTGDQQPAPFHGYYFRILTSQGPSAPGGAKSYVVNGELSGGHALVAWPAVYDNTGVMTFLTSRDGVVHEKDLGPDSAALAKAMTGYDPDGSWRLVK